jgi:hypothetical protein
MADETLPVHDEFVDDIAPDVLGVLRQIRFFELLDDSFCPTDLTQNASQCAHSFEVSGSILAGLGMSADDIQDVLDVLSSQGASCDCEILYNVAEESRFRARYWKDRYAEARDR